MTNITAILEKYGISIPEDKRADFEKDFAANYKTIAEFEKKTGNLETELSAWRQRAETAETALKELDGVDVKGLQAQIDTYKQKAADAEADFRRQLEERDFNDILKAELGNVKFTSTAARKSVEGAIRAAGLKVSEGKILGLTDILAQLRESDAGAFVDEAQEELEAGRARVTTSIGGGSSPTGKSMTRNEIMAIKDRDQRRAAIAANMKLFEK